MGKRWDIVEEEWNMTKRELAQRRVEAADNALASHQGDVVGEALVGIAYALLAIHDELTSKKP